MQYFRKYLNGSSSNISTCTSIPDKKADPPFCYVKQWLKTDEGILFRLNNKVIQVNFLDKSQLVIYSEKGIIVFTAKNHGQKSFYQLGSNEIPEGC